MFTAQVLPDEFSLGYSGRLRILNVLSSGKELTAALRKEMYPVSGKHLAEISEAAVLAEAADIPLQQFIKNHTLLPFHRMAAWEGDYVIAHGDPSVPSLINYFGSRVFSSSLARFCLECAEEEIGTKGFTYWRRTYQLPGFFKCFKHGTQLANGKAGSKCFDSMPSSRLSFEFEFSEQEVLELSANAIVQRYVDLGKSILGSDRPVDVHYASSRLYQRAKMLRKRDRQRNFLEFTSERIPEFWLRMLSVRTINNLAGSSMDSVNCFNFGMAAECYVVAAEIWGELVDPRDKLKFLVSEAGVSVRAAAKQVGVSVVQAAQYLRREGVEYTALRPRVLDPGKENQLQALLISGEDRDVISTKLGIRKDYIKDYLMKNAELREIWREACSKKLQEQHRAHYLELLRNHEGFSLAQIRKIPGNGILWLWRHDREWLERNMPSLWRKQVHGTSPANCNLSD